MYFLLFVSIALTTYLLLLLISEKNGSGNLENVVKSEKFEKDD